MYTFTALCLPSDIAAWSLPVVSAVSLHLVAWMFCQFSLFLPFLDTLVVFGTSSSSKSVASLSPDESLGETSHTWGLYSELSQPLSEPESLYGSHATGSSSSVILGYQWGKLLQIFQHSPSHSSGSADLAGSEMGGQNGATVEWFEEEVHHSFCSLQRLSLIWAMFLMLFFCFSLVLSFSWASFSWISSISWGEQHWQIRRSRHVPRENLCCQIMEERSCT